MTVAAWVVGIVLGGCLAAIVVAVVLVLKLGHEVEKTEVDFETPFGDDPGCCHFRLALYTQTEWDEIQRQPDLPSSAYVRKTVKWDASADSTVAEDQGG